jgi:hypothetical protein
MLTSKHIARWANQAHYSCKTLQRETALRKIIVWLTIRENPLGLARIAKKRW